MTTLQANSNRLFSRCGIVAVVTLALPAAARTQAEDRLAPPATSSSHFVRPADPVSATVVARYSRPPVGDNPVGFAARIPSRTVASDASVAGPLLAEPPRYWIVSSRKLPQELPWTPHPPMEVFERLPEGTLIKSDMASMTCQLVPGVPVCIFVHGTFVSAAWHQEESSHTYEWLRQSAPQLPVQVIFFTWPSDADSLWASPLLINLRGRWAENNGFYIAELIAHLPAECPVCLVGHSHGGRAVASTLHLLGGGQVGGYTLPFDPGPARRVRAVLAAAAFDRHWLNPGERYGCAIGRTEGILNLRNATDLALHVYPFRRPFSRQAIGETGFTLWDRARLGALSIRAIDLDVAPFIGLGHTWLYYYHQPRIAQSIVPYTYFVDP